MFTRLRSTWLAGGGAVLLALSLSGVVAAAALVTAIVTPQVEEVLPVVDTTLTFEDLDGDGIDDDCDDEVVANEADALAAEEAADLDGDGVISTSEAAQSNRIGGKNCNHGGYVSTVAHADEACDVVVDPTCEEPAEEGPAADPAEEPVVCETVPVVEEPVVEEPVDLAKNAHGKAVVKVAHDKDAVGGKNCNHGGAVSEAAKKDHAGKDAAKAAAKAERAKNHADKAKSHGKKNGG